LGKHIKISIIRNNIISVKEDKRLAVSQKCH
jgi:hypothetical protein